MNDWQYGRIRTAKAYRIGNRLVVRVDGTQPVPCCDVMLRRYVPDHGADVRLALYWKPRVQPCGEERAPYSARLELAVGDGDVGVVRVYHADGYTDVPVLRSVPG
ncbi:MAG TPA: hypothetical protein VF142_13125 [Longimicrobium sp.]